MADLDPITLLSSSPRRRDIIRALLNPVWISGSRGEEPRPDEGESPEEYVVRCAVAKLGGAAQAGDAGILVGADTVVALDGDILGKPNCDEEARLMLRRLRNRLHLVITGVAALDAGSGEMRSCVETSRIYARDYSDEDIEMYIARREPFDKAGAYAVQDDEFRPVIRVEGCYLNVVGLPLCRLVDLVESLGAKLKLRSFAEIPYYGRCEGCRLKSDDGSET